MRVCVICDKNSKPGQEGRERERNNCAKKVDSRQHWNMRQVNFLGKTAFTWLTLMCYCCGCCVCKIKSFHSRPGFCVGMKMDEKNGEIFVRSLIASAVAHERHARAPTMCTFVLVVLYPHPGRDHAQYARHARSSTRTKCESIFWKFIFLLGISKHGKNGSSFSRNPLPHLFPPLNCARMPPRSLETYSVWYFSLWDY